MDSELDYNSSHLENLITDAINKAFLSPKQLMGINEWMSLKEGAKYAGVSYNTLMKFRLMGLKISEIDGVKRVSKKEIDRFLEQHSF
ncbi:helix-turn-helix domain-containing protein [Lysinibacillus capsici]|uniref:helix-turn-helix domain-containing protein n=1 Tax=Lysinibacillus capsici TaxID=2115968 RepID=UPI0028AA3D0B|nr:helix-turn-helix domain-containing protein [Lysinibacillus capsici]